MKRPTILTTTAVVLGIFATVFLYSCEKEEDTSPSGSGGSSSGSSYKGTWVRVVAASGDETDLAIGNITGEPENRVYMCEWKGAVGLYKGYINGNTITFDDKYSLPNAQVGLEDGQLTLYYPSVSYSVKTYYNSGSWSSKCGPLSNSNNGGSGGSGNGQVVFWTQSDHGCGPISVSINGQSGTVTKYYSSTPDCGALGCATFSLAPGSYNFTATCGSYSWGNTNVTVAADGCFKMQLN